MKLLILVLALFWSLPTNAQFLLKGSVKDANGKAPIASDIHIAKFGDGANTGASYRCNKDGSFEIMLPKPGYFLLRASAVNHAEISLPLLVRETDKQTELTIDLRPNVYRSSYERVRIIGDWNNFKFSGTDTMTRSGAKYTYSRKAENDTVSYQLLDIAGSHSVNGTHADYFVYDGGGDYRSVLKTKKGATVTITFDPEKISYPQSPTPAAIDFHGNRFLENIYRLQTTAASMHQNAMTTPAGGGAATMDAEKYQGIIDFLRQEFELQRKAGDLETMQFAAVTLADQYHPMPPFDSVLAKKILDAVPANSPMWAIAPQAAIVMCSLIGKEASLAYESELATSNPSRTVRAIAYTHRLAAAYEAKDEQTTRQLYTLVKREYGDVPDIKWQLFALNPDAVVQVGKKVPTFELDLLGTSTKVSNTSLLGKYYMIDFWATWCAPCVREMPAIHKAYDRFKGRKGFDILSISMDGSVGQIAPFRKKWPMPWQHAFIPGVFDAEVAKRFEVAGIPKPVLVDPNGTIVAMQEDLRGEILEQTLEKFLGGAN